MPTAQSADGVLHDFPDGTDPAVIDRVMKQYAQEQQDTLQEGRRGGSAREVPSLDELDTQKKVDADTKQIEALDAQGVDKLDPRYKKLLKERYTAKQYTPQGREDTTKNLAAGELGGVALQGVAGLAAKTAGKSTVGIKIPGAETFVLDHIFVFPSDPRTIYVAAWRTDAPGGGIWVSHDAGIGNMVARLVPIGVVKG